METQVSALLKDRNEVPDENEEEQDTNHDQNPSSPEPPPSPPPSPVPTHYPSLQNSNQPLDQLPVQYPAQQPSADMDQNKTSGTERLAVTNPIGDSMTIENSQHTSKYFLVNILKRPFFGIF